MDNKLIFDIVEKAKKGNKGALETLYRETHNRVYFYAYRIFNDENDAADVVQEVFIKVFTRLEDLEDINAFPNWLYKITINECRQLLRKNRKQILLDEGEEFFEHIADEEPEMDMRLTYKDARAYLMHIIDLLPREQKSAILLYYYEQLTIKQIAEIEGVSENSIKSRLHLARKKIRNAVEAEERRTGSKILVSSLPALAVTLAEGAIQCTMPTMLAANALAVALAAVGFIDGEATITYISTNEYEEDKSFFQKMRSGILLEVKPYKLIYLLLIITILGIGVIGAVKTINVNNEKELSQDISISQQSKDDDTKVESFEENSQPGLNQLLELPVTGTETMYTLTPDETGYYCFEGTFEAGKFVGRNVCISTYRGEIKPERLISKGVISMYREQSGEDDVYAMYFTDTGLVEGGQTYYLLLNLETDMNIKELRLVRTDVPAV